MVQEWLKIPQHASKVVKRNHACHTLQTCVVVSILRKHCTHIMTVSLTVSPKGMRVTVVRCECGLNDLKPPEKKCVPIRYSDFCGESLGYPGLYSPFSWCSLWVCRVCQRAKRRRDWGHIVFVSNHMLFNHSDHSVTLWGFLSLRILVFVLNPACQIRPECVAVLLCVIQHKSNI